MTCFRSRHHPVQSGERRASMRHSDHGRSNEHQPVDSPGARRRSCVSGGMSPCRKNVDPINPGKPQRRRPVEPQSKQTPKLRTWYTMPYVTCIHGLQQTQIYL
ncbi:hypothetical protein BC628DRAFT_1391215 [Trametes gibbosa]|nr:hypothetical protein BC628DRAFT_1391215 [Trametes gibbosa]